ncbi:MAG: hypothetical protein LUC22_00655, partial [Prevotella sp.]|nr:hypothetical protein [Prevotella sp.]
EYPESQWTALLSDPYFADNQRFGIHIEDSLYAATYNAFKADRDAEIRANVRISKERFPLGFNRDKFVFIGGLSKLNTGDADGCLEDMNTVVTEFPTSKLAELAGMIINGVKAGRQLRGGRFDVGDVWARRSMVLSETDSLDTRELSAETDMAYYFLIAYEPDSVNTNQLLYQLARFNFSNYLVRDFDLELEDRQGLNVMRIGGFNNYFEAREYAREFYRQESIRELVSGGKTFIISGDNLSLLGTHYSYDDYEAFYAEHFEPLEQPGEQLLFEQNTPRGELDDGGSIPGNISPILQREQEEEQEGEDEYAIPDDSGTVIFEDEENNTGTEMIIEDGEPATDTGSDVIINEEEPEPDNGTDIIMNEKEPESDNGTDIIVDEEEPAKESDNIIIEDGEEPGSADIYTFGEDNSGDGDFELDDGDYILGGAESEEGEEDEYFELDGF